MGFMGWPLDCPSERNGPLILEMSSDYVNYLLQDAIKISSQTNADEMKAAAQKLVTLRNDIIGLFGDHCIRNLAYFTSFKVHNPNKNAFLDKIQQLKDMLAPMRKPPSEGGINPEYRHWQVVYDSINEIVADV